MELKENEMYNLTAIFVFPVYLPPGFFSRLVVRLNQPQFELQYEAHWKTGIYARHKHGPLAYLIE